MTYYIRMGASFRIADSNALDIKEILPPATYTVAYDKMAEQYFLEIVDNLEVAGKIYGDTPKLAQRILDTFEDRKGSTGIMLSGEKGSGKTLLARVLSADALRQGIPTIIINEPWHGEQFNTFMQSIEQPTVVLFDEFEKTYQDRVKQEAMLTLFDGVYQSKKLFIITCNDAYRVNDHMKNRPGRIYYRKDYKGLEREFIEEYCQDNLKDKSHIPAICRIAVAFSEFNFDILKALVEEMNRYGEDPRTVMELLNAKPEFSTSTTYTTRLTTVGGKTIRGSWTGSPLNGTVIRIWLENDSDVAAVFGSNDPDNDEYVDFHGNDLISLNHETGEFNFQNRDGHKLSLIKATKSAYNKDAF
jgi:hypothetical protein